MALRTLSPAGNADSKLRRGYALRGRADQSLVCASKAPGASPFSRIPRILVKGEKEKGQRHQGEDAA